MLTFAHKFKNPNKRRNTTKDLTGMVVTAMHTPWDNDFQKPAFKGMA